MTFRRMVLLGVLAVTFMTCPNVHAADWMPLVGAFHVHSSQFSSGSHGIEELGRMARDRAVDVIVLTDHDQVSLSYGLPPFPNLFSWTVSRKSVLKEGAQNYLDAVNRADDADPDVILIPGLETAPFYYWEGGLRQGKLTAHDWRKHIHVIGLDSAEDIENLPTLRRGFSTRYFFRLLPPFSIFMGVSLLSVVMIFWGGPVGLAGKILLIAAVLGAIDAHPFRLSPFDPFHGPRGGEPYQELIDYVDQKGGMTFWAHLEARYGEREILPFKEAAGIALPQLEMETGVHPVSLLHTEGYTGFESLYGDTFHATDPGKEWDRALLQYVEGIRKRPAWGLCGLDFHEEGMTSWSRLDRGQTVFLVSEKTRAAVLDAMRHGRMYAVYQGGAGKLWLEEFRLSSPVSGESRVSGETLDTRGEPMAIKTAVALTGGPGVPIRVDLIDSGKVLTTIEGETPLNVERSFFPARSQGYIRLEISSPNHRLISNPIFYKN